MSDTPETDVMALSVLRTDHNWRQLSRKLERERDEAREQLRKASVEANTLATSIQKTEYPDAKEFELLGSVAGVISQIDNMYAGVRQQRDKAREDVMELQDIKRKHEHEELAAAQENDRLKQERDEARTELDMWRDGNIMHQIHRDELEKTERERDEAMSVAEQLYEAAAYGLAQWESATPATLADKIVPALQAFQKLKAQ
jgi:sRNA-binding protein